MKTRYIALLGSGLALVQAAAAPGAVQRFSLSQEQVREVVVGGFAARGIGMDGALIELPMKVITSVVDPALEIRSIENIPGLRTNGKSESRSAVRMRCRQPGTCLPFYAIVRWPEGVDRDGVHSSVKVESIVNPKADVMMRVGAHATLVMDDGHMHIRLAVVSLESGVAGSSIRVATPDHRKIYVGHVVSAELLKGSF
jgi:hypothetical protein